MSGSEPEEDPDGTKDPSTELGHESTLGRTNFPGERRLRLRVWNDPNVPKPGGTKPWGQPDRGPFKLERDILKEYKIKKKTTISPMVGEKKGNRYLHWAVDPWNETEAKEALENGGADVNSKNYSGMTPLHLVAQQNLPGAVETLIKFGANLEIKDTLGFTPLHHAVANKARVSIAALLAAGSNPETQNLEGETPLLTAIRKNSEPIVKSLVGAGAVINPPEGTEAPPLHMTARLKRKAIMSLLIKLGADVGLRDEQGKTPLHHAAQVDEYKGMFILLDAGGQINAKNYEGDTPLHLSLKSDAKRTTTMLIQMGADYSIPNAEGGVMDEALVELVSDKSVRFRGLPGNEDKPDVFHKYHGPLPRLKHSVWGKKARVKMGMGHDWDDKLLEQQEYIREKKKELRGYRMEKDRLIKEKWNSPFVFKQKEPPKD